MSIEEIIEKALQEDIREGDHTTLACIPENETETANLLIKEKGILAGMEVAEMVFKKFDSDLQLYPILADGAEVKQGDIAFKIIGKARSILSTERLVLNIMQRMSGIASHTRKLVNLLENTHTKLLDTRKTTPNFRALEKMAVKIGGGENHRFGLFDMMMIKDNHIDYAGGITTAINSCKAYLKRENLYLKIEVEARNLKEVDEILQCGVDRIMLDNFNFKDLKEAVKLVDGRAETEASGGITEQTLGKYAETGVDFISVGALTHQIKSLDMSLKAGKC